VTSASIAAQAGVDERDVRTSVEQPPGDAFSDGAGSARDQGHLAAQNGRGALAELRLLERPVLHVEEITLGDPLVAPDRGGPELRADRVFGDVRGDGRGAARLADREQAEARHHDHARRRIEGRALDTLGLDVAPEVGLVRLAVGGDLLPELRPERLEVAVRRIRDEQVRALRADRVVRGDRRRVRQQRAEVGRGEVQDLVVRAVLQDPAPERLIRIPGRLGQRAAHQRSDLARVARRHDRPRVEWATGSELLQDVLLGAVHQLDVPLVAGARVGAEAEQAVLLQHQPLDLGRLLEDLGRALREQEARHDVRDPGDALAVELADAPLPVRLVGQRQDGVGVGVIDEARWKKGMQQRLH
jgi:hypothetical protein